MNGQGSFDLNLVALMLILLLFGNMNITNNEPKFGGEDNA